METPQRENKQPRVRQRIQRACGPCRKRKIKCDGDEPCAACAGYGYVCSYEREALPPRKRPSSIRKSSPMQTQADSLGASEPELVPTQKEPEEVDAPFLASESNVQDPSGSFRQSHKTRFTSAHSAIAWPKTVGLSLGLPIPPRLQSFAWNPGTRPEPSCLPQTSIRDIISLEEMKTFASAFFELVHPFFGVLDQEMFEKRSIDFWFSQQQGTDFEACVCGVVSLGSYFSGSTPSSSEAQVAEQGKLLLDSTISHPAVLLSVKHVAAWIFRALYLRCTTRPHLSWMASNNALHIAEAIGLHRELGQTPESYDTSQTDSTREKDLRRRTFWVAMALNQFFASEYGRTRVHIDFIELKPLVSRTGDLTAETIAVLQSVPRTQVLPGSGSDLVSVLRKAAVLPAKAPFLGLLRADACFCIFRMLSLAHVHLPETEVATLLEVIRVGLDAVKFSSALEIPWWNIIFMPFHSICVLLTIGTSESLAMIPMAMETLEKVTEAYNSHLSAEALRTAYTLVQGTREKRRKELESLDESLSKVGDVSQLLPSNKDAEFGIRNFDWSMDDELGVTDFLDLSTYYGIVS